jgi:hypothetical protein
VEQWKKIDGFAGGYEISSKGRARSIKTGKILNKIIKMGKYPIFQLTDIVVENGVKYKVTKQRSVKRLVKEYFSE